MPDSLPYDETPDPRWSDDAVDRFNVSPVPSKGTPYLLELAGKCPRCDHYMEAEYWRITFSGVAPMDREDKIRAGDAIAGQNLMPSAKGIEQFPVRCTCTGEHRRRDGEFSDKGCGAPWMMAVEL